MLAPKMIFENNDFMVVYKPSGLNSDQDKQGNPSLETWLMEYCKKQVFLVNRLDRPVNGILIATKKKSVLHFLQKNWNNYKKLYLAIVEGNIQPENQLLKHYHQKDLKNFKALIKNEPFSGSQICQLYYKMLKSNEKFSLIEVELITGRYHQIRAQLGYYGFPIVGDHLYGSKMMLNFGFPKIALSAYQFHFYYPDKKNFFQFQIFTPEDFLTEFSSLTEF